MTIALDLHALNEAPTNAFQTALGPLFESAPRFLARLAAERPFDDWDRLFEIGRAIAHVMPEAEQIELVDSHPRLGAAPGTVSAMSFREQGYHEPATRRTGTTGGAAGDPDRHVAAELTRLNEAYEARFGFRYCVYVAGRSRAALLPEMRAALKGGREAELHRALDAVVDIAQARLATQHGGAT